MRSSCSVMSTSHILLPEPARQFMAPSSGENSQQAIMILPEVIPLTAGPEQRLLTEGYSTHIAPNFSRFPVLRTHNSPWQVPVLSYRVLEKSSFFWSEIQLLSVQWFEPVLYLV